MGTREDRSGTCEPSSEQGRRAIDCGTNSIRLLIADIGRRPAARRAPRDAHRAAGPRRRRHRAIRAGRARAHPGGAGRLRRAAAQSRGTQGADGGDVGGPRRRQPRRVLRDDGRRARRRGARCGGRGDHRHRGGRAVLPRCRRTNWTPPQRLSWSSTSAAVRPRWCWATRDVRGRASPPTSGACG